MKQIILNFNNLIKKTIFKVQNKTNNKNNKLKISNFNKYLISFIALLFVYLFYLLLPTLYDANWVQNSIEKKLLKEFKIKLSSSHNITYRILPAPHFLIKDSKILINDKKKIKSIAEIKNLKVFLSQKNLFDKEKIKLKKITINNANFLLSVKDFKLFNRFSNNQFSNKKIIINKSKFFFKDHLNQVIAISKVNKGILFYDEQKLLNSFSLKGEIFKLPFDFEFTNKNNSIQIKKTNISFNDLKLNIFNKSKKIKDKGTNGTNTISFLSSTIKTNYKIEDGGVKFNSNKNEIKNSTLNYKGKLSINPFDLDLNVNFDKYEIIKILNLNSILTEFIQTRLLFNENISLNTTIVISSSSKGDLFHKAKINFNIVNGKINFNKTKFINNKIGFVELDNSNLFFEKDILVLNTDVKIKIENRSKLFSFLQTNKTSRKEISNILINLDYEILSKGIKFNNIKVDNNEVNDQVYEVIQGFNDNNINNINKSRRILNELLRVYEG